MAEEEGLIFISCGQHRPDEIKLGEDLAAGVNELTPFEGYFAQNLTSLDGLSRNILGALNRKTIQPVWSRNPYSYGPKNRLFCLGRS